MLSPLTLQVKMINLFVIGAIPKLRHILEQTNELTKLSIRNTNRIDTESIGSLISIVSDLIHSRPPRLRKLNFDSIGGSAEQGEQILMALYDS